MSTLSSASSLRRAAAVRSGKKSSSQYLMTLDSVSAKPLDPPGADEVPSPRASKSITALRSTTMMEEIRAVAQQFADEPLQSPEPGVWGVLTAISNNSRQRRQGMNIRLRSDEHLIGRCVEDSRFKISSIAVSATHCRIYREKASESPGSNILSVFVKDTSTNGTYLNWDKLTKDMPGSRLRHGDILAFAAPPHEGNSYAYVYREVYGARLLENGTATLKRQREDVSSGCKRQKGIGIGSVDGPISLDDVRSLQRSNSDLRQQLESHVRTIETLKSESRESIARHENEIKELKETISSSFEKQIKELEHELGKAHKELDKLRTVKVDLDYSIEDLRERLNASKQSRSDADDIILSQKATISELEKQLEEEQKMRREERDKAAEDLRSALEKAHSEAKEESKRQANIYQRQHKEQQEVITKLQECEKESRLLVETLRSKLDDARENLIISEKKVRQLESQVQDEQLACTNSKKRSEDLESELRSLKAELENEKVAREQAWAKVSALELEIAAAIRDLSVEKRRFQGARERVILRETQLRAFYSTTEEISALFARQQEQLKAMQRTLEDEDHYENTLTDIDLNQTPPRKVDARNEDTCPITANREVSQERVAESSGRDSVDGDASTTVKNSDNNDTQDLECTSVYRSVQGTDMNVDGGVSTAIVHEKGQIDTEQVLETEIQAGDGTDQKCWNMEGETMQLDEETVPAENYTEPIARTEVDARLEDTEPCQVQTADLLTSEAVGSWAVSTAPSINVGNESPRKVTNAEAVGANALIGLLGQASGSQSNKVNESRKLTKEQKRLNAMIEIVDPEFGQKFSANGGVRTGSDISDAETEEGDNDGDDGSEDDSKSGGDDDSKSGGDDDSKSGDDDDRKSGGDDDRNDGGHDDNKDVGDDESDGSETMIKDSVG